MGECVFACIWKSWVEVCLILILLRLWFGISLLTHPMRSSTVASLLVSNVRLEPPRSPALLRICFWRKFYKSSKRLHLKTPWGNVYLHVFGKVGLNFVCFGFCYAYGLEFHSWPIPCDGLLLPACWSQMFAWSRRGHQLWFAHVSKANSKN